MSGAEHLVDRAERKLGLRFPPGYREVFRSRPFLTGLDAVELLAPVDVHRIETDPWFEAGDYEVPAAGAVVIGRDIGGNLLFLRPDPADPTVLEETVWRWDHDGSETERVAFRLVDMFDDEHDPLERWANELLGDEFREDDD